MTEARTKRPSMVPPLLLTKIKENVTAERIVGEKALHSPHSNLLSPSGTSQHFLAALPQKKRRGSTKAYVQNLLAELKRDHAYGPDKIIVGGSVGRSASHPPSVSPRSPRRMSGHYVTSVKAAKQKENTGFSVAVCRDKCQSESPEHSRKCLKSFEDTPRSIISEVSSGRNTPRDLFLEIDGSPCEDAFSLPLPCLQTHTSNQNTQTDAQESRSQRASPRRGEDKETQTADAQESKSITASPQREDQKTQTELQESDELVQLRQRVWELEEERRVKYAQMKATALEEVIDLMGQMQRSHEEVEQMFSSRIEELEERLKEKEEECQELESAVEELDLLNESDKATAALRLSQVESRLDTVSSSLLLRRSVVTDLVAFIASRTLRIPALRRLSSSLLSPGTGRPALDYYQPPVSGFAHMLSVFSISITGALEIGPASTSDMLAEEACPRQRRPYMAYLVRCVVDTTPAEELAEGGRGTGEAAAACELCVLRRFSDFVALYSALAAKLGQEPLKLLPPLPRKYWWGARSRGVVMERVTGLHKLMEALPAVCWRDDEAAEVALQFLLGRKEDVLPATLQDPLSSC